MQTSKFLGAAYEYKVNGFRLCTKCGKAEEWIVADYGGFWNTLSGPKADILRSKVGT
jgi:hypothetical protein